jgi:hypothetical protein
LLLDKLLSTEIFFWISLIGIISWLIVYFRLLTQKCPRCKDYYFGAIFSGGGSYDWATNMYRVPESRCGSCGLILKKYI